MAPQAEVNASFAVQFDLFRNAFEGTPWEERRHPQWMSRCYSGGKSQARRILPLSVVRRIGWTVESLGPIFRQRESDRRFSLLRRPRACRAALCFSLSEHRRSDNDDVCHIRTLMSPGMQRPSRRPLSRWLLID